MRSLLLCMLLSALSLAPAHAQLSFGSEVGVNISNYYGRLSGVTQHYSTSIPGLRLGAIADVGITKTVYLQPGLFYVRNGYNLAALDLLGNKYNVTFRVSALELPVNVLYKLHLRSGSRLLLGGGPYVAANMGGRQKAEFLPGGIHKISIGSNKSDDITAIDAGLGASIGFQLPAGFIIHLHYQQSLVNEQAGGDKDNSMHNVNYGVSLAYLFATGHKKTGLKKPVHKH